jgi:hypothetical protein
MKMQRRVGRHCFAKMPICYRIIGVVSVVSQYMVYNCVYYCDRVRCRDVREDIVLQKCLFCAYVTCHRIIGVVSVYMQYNCV